MSIKKIGFFEAYLQSIMEVQQRIGRQRIKHIVDSYLLTGSGELAPFNAYLDDLLTQYPHGLIELALVETLVENWLNVPMQKGIPFLEKAHERLKQWQLEPAPARSLHHQLTPSQFSQITGLDAQVTLSSLDCPATPVTQTASD